MGDAVSSRAPTDIGAIELPTELVERRIRVASELVVLVKGICEASEGLCAMFAEHGGELVLAAPRSREQELDELIRDFKNDFGATLDD